jgi:hypothetical protein
MVCTNVDDEEVFEGGDNNATGLAEQSNEQSAATVIQN